MRLQGFSWGMAVSVGVGVILAGLVGGLIARAL
jgi:hypothetical protein